MIFPLTSGVRQCQDATSSRRAKSVQAVCRQGGGVLTQVLYGIITCEIWDAGAIPAAATERPLVEYHKWPLPFYL